MSRTTTTSADRQARPRATPETVISAMRDLEDDIHGLVNMSHILTEMLQLDLSAYGPQGRIEMPPKGGVMTVHLSHSQMEALSFAWHDVASRAEKLRQRFNAAWDGEVAP